MDGDASFMVLVELNGITTSPFMRGSRSDALEAARVARLDLSARVSVIRLDALGNYACVEVDADAPLEG